MNRRLAALVLATAAALTLTACSEATDSQGNRTGDVIRPHYVELPDGRSVLCILERDNTAGSIGLSCDWSTAK